MDKEIKKIIEKVAETLQLNCYDKEKEDGHMLLFYYARPQEPIFIEEFNKIIYIRQGNPMPGELVYVIPHNYFPNMIEKVIKLTEFLSKIKMNLLRQV